MQGLMTKGTPTKPNFPYSKSMEFSFSKFHFHIFVFTSHEYKSQSKVQLLLVGLQSCRIHRRWGGIPVILVCKYAHPRAQLVTRHGYRLARSNLSHRHLRVCCIKQSPSYPLPHSSMHARQCFAIYVMSLTRHGPNSRFFVAAHKESINQAQLYSLGLSYGWRHLVKVGHSIK